MNPEQTAITDTLKAYQTAMGRGDLDAVVAVFTEDAVLMAPGNKSTVGIQGVRAAYGGMIQAMTFDMTFQVAEVQQFSGEWAMIRTTSSGTITLRDTNKAGPEGNQELFILQNISGGWKIARYCFNAVIPG